MKSEKESRLCHVPVKAEFKITEDEKVELISAEYEDIPADLIVKYLQERINVSEILESLRDE